MIIIILIALVIIVLIINSAKKNNEQNELNAKFAAHNERLLAEHIESQAKRKLLDKKILEDFDIKYLGKPSIEFDLAGLFYRSNKAKELAENVYIGESVKLKLDPNNEYDSTAVKVYYENIHIGFVPGSISEDITMFIKKHNDIESFVIDNQFIDDLPDITIRIYGERK